MMRLLARITVAATLVLGCARTGSPDSAANPGGAEDPAAAVSNLLRLQVEDEPKEALRFVRPEDRALLVAMAYQQTASLFAVPDSGETPLSRVRDGLVALRARYGLPRIRTDDLFADPDGYEREVRAAAVVISVADAPELAAELSALMKEARRVNGSRAKPPSFELGAPRIEGRRAFINVEVGADSIPVEVVQQEGRWYLDYEALFSGMVSAARDADEYPGAH